MVVVVVLPVVVVVVLVIMCTIGSRGWSQWLGMMLKKVSRSHTTRVSSDNVTMVGTKNFKTLSANPCMGAFCAWDSCTRSVVECGWDQPIRMLR